MTHVTCRLTAKDRNQLRNPTLSNRVWTTTFYLLPLIGSYTSIKSGIGLICLATPQAGGLIETFVLQGGGRSGGMRTKPPGVQGRVSAGGLGEVPQQLRYQCILCNVNSVFVNTEM